MKTFLRFTWAIYFFIWFLVVFLLFYPLFLLFLSNRKHYAKAHKLRAIWGRIIMFLSGLRPKTTFEQQLDPQGQYIFVANHFSYLDILSLNVQTGFYFRFLAKSELAKIPVFNIFFKTIDIAVERKSMRGAMEAFRLAGNALNEGDSLGIFPEGGIADQVPNMVRFKSGAFRMAIENNIPVVPITIVDNWKRLPQGGLDSGGTPGKMRMVVHNPIPTSELTTDHLSDLMDRTYNIIQNTFDRLNFEVGK
ncbi:MAG: 1-acyl-sn-glycerol-3-phosphate acyltransferase [Bacteroidia bacterium]|nr:1-acyl-sn-glycerol-3-phosphate acyltransferase [Bacteroidia bacterium]